MLLCSGLSALNWHLVVHSAVNFSKICFFIHSSCGSWCVVVMCVHSKLMLNMFVVHAGPMDRRGGSFKYRNLDRSVKVATWLIDSQSAQAWNKGEIVKIWKFWNRKNRENSQSVCNCCLLHQCYITLDLLLGLYKTALLTISHFLDALVEDWLWLNWQSTWPHLYLNDGGPSLLLMHNVRLLNQKPREKRIIFWWV